MNKTIVINTGGTIAMTADDESGSIKQQKEQPLQRLLPLLRRNGEIEMDHFLNLPSPHMTPQFMLRLARRAQQYLEKEEVSGVVVTHGTDTLEETAYLLDLVIDSPKPVVVTGAMRGENEWGADGPLNLLHSVIVAMDPNSRERGTLVVFNEQIHEARFVSKVHTSNVSAFDSEFGPIGTIANGQARFWTAPKNRRTRFSVENLVANVPLIKATTGMRKEWVSFLLDEEIDGVVFEAFGIGNLPPTLVPVVEELIQRRKPVVLVSRCPQGFVQPLYDYEGGGAQLSRSGVIFAAGESGPKARLKLMLALDSGISNEDIKKLFHVPDKL